MPGQEDETPTPDAAAAARSPSPSALGELMPFAKTLGVVFDVAGKDEVRAHLAWAPELCTSGGLLHGGVLM
jgi:1,4-dihydroxy-2-naphthoyl-CoA hydrolase